MEGRWIDVWSGRAIACVGLLYVRLASRWKRVAR